MTQPLRPFTILIAALGGEGGGVLTDWIVKAAETAGFPVQSTSIPGVAQRTGATTYYIEIYPVPRAALDGREPIFALTPGVGDIDVLLASELMEAARATTAGFVASDRTRAVVSTARQYVMTEKIAPGDGRANSAMLIDAVARHARQALVFDMEEVARSCGAMINAVMAGALAGSGSLPFDAEALEAAMLDDIRGREANRRGFDAGLARARQAADTTQEADATVQEGMLAPETRAQSATGSEAGAVRRLPAAAHADAAEGARQLRVYQNEAYAELYLTRLTAIARADVGADGALTATTARFLATRMAFDDVIRVAEAKLDGARWIDLTKQAMLTSGDSAHVIEVLKPGIEELCSLLPPVLARPLLAWGEHRGWLGRVYWPMTLRSTSINGYLRLRALAALKTYRPRSFRFAQEQDRIDAWLNDVVAALSLSEALALEIARCAGLIKGYGETYQRGLENFRILMTRIVRPAIAGQIAPEAAAEALLNARLAALKDAEGMALTACLAAIDERLPRAPAAA